MEKREDKLGSLKRRGLLLFVCGILFVVFGFVLLVTLEDGKLVYHLESGRNVILATFDFLVGFILVFLYRKNRIKIKVQEELSKIEKNKVTDKQLMSKIKYCLSLNSIKNSDYVKDRLKEVRKLVAAKGSLSEEDLQIINHNLNQLKTIRQKQVSQKQMQTIKEVCNNLDEIISSAKKKPAG